MTSHVRCTEVCLKPALSARLRTIFSERERDSMLSPVRLSSVTFVHPTQPVEIFGNVSTPFGRLANLDIQEKLYRDRPKGTPPSGGGGLNAKGVAKYSDFGPIEGYISETVQNRR